jgi:RNA polymerase sigma-70 factor (ECF subfamily)
VVLSAREANSPESAQALETLCRTYWLPLYVFVRKLGHNRQDAQDLTQEFFARLLQKQFLQSAQRDKGRFRTFLLVSLKRFLANEWDRQHAQKRGGFAPVVSIDQEQGESCLAWEAAQNLQPDALYDRQWAVTLLERTMSRLREEYALTGRAKLFERLEPCLAKEQSALPYAQIAKELNLSEAAVKMAVQRLRARYRELLREEIAATVESPGEVEEEIRYLFSTFAQ